MKIYLLTIIIGFILEMLGADILVKQNICFAKITKIPKVYLSADYLFHGKHSMRILSGIDGVILFLK